MIDVVLDAEVFVVIHRQRSFPTIVADLANFQLRHHPLPFRGVSTKNTFHEPVKSAFLFANAEEFVPSTLCDGIRKQPPLFFEEASQNRLNDVCVFDELLTSWLVIDIISQRGWQEERLFFRFLFFCEQHRNMPE